MKELISSLIAGAFAILFGVMFIKIYNEIQDKKRRKEQLYFAEKRLHKMTLHFRDDCMEETKKLVAKYAALLTCKSYRYSPDYMTYSFLSDYRKTIDSIKEDYIVNYAIRYSKGDNWLRCEAEDLPISILGEYETEITEIANTFDDLCDSMRKQIEELKDKQ